MGRFTHAATGVTFSVDDSKDERYEGPGYEAASDSESKATSKRSSSSKSSK